MIKSLNVANANTQSLEEIAEDYISEEKGVKNLEEALQGASDILAEEVAEKANLRAYLRDLLMKESVFMSSKKIIPRAVQNMKCIVIFKLVSLKLLLIIS